MHHLLLANRSDVLAPNVGDSIRTEFKQKTQRAFSTIIMAVSTPQLYLVTTCKEPKEVWDKLCKCETLANKLFLKKYFRTEMKEGTYICSI